MNSKQIRFVGLLTRTNENEIISAVFAGRLPLQIFVHIRLVNLEVKYLYRQWNRHILVHRFYAHIVDHITQ